MSTCSHFLFVCRLLSLPGTTTHTPGTQRQSTHQQWVSFGLFFLAHDVLLFISICVCVRGRVLQRYEFIFHLSSWSQPCPQRSVKVCYSFLPARLLDCKSPCSPLRADTSKTCRRLLLTSRCEVKWHRCQGIGSETETGGAGAECHKHDKVFLSFQVDPIETGEFIMANYSWSDLVCFSFSILGRVQLIKVTGRKGCRRLMSF